MNLQKTPIAIPNDPWGRAYVYRAPGQQGGEFELFSSGEDADIGLAQSQSGQEVSLNK
jgi:hypothetical protein